MKQQECGVREFVVTTSSPRNFKSSSTAHVFAGCCTSLPVWAEPPHRKMALGDPRLDIRYHVWIIVSAAFSFYVSEFANYDKLYGSLGAVIVLPLYLAFYIVLLGAEINAELELQTARDTTDGKPLPIGERGAFVADHVAGGRLYATRKSSPPRCRRSPNPFQGPTREDLLVYDIKDSYSAGLKSGGGSCDTLYAHCADRSIWR